MRKYIILLIILAAIEISLSLYLTHFKEVFWNAIAAKNLHGFISQLGVFTVIALSLCFISGCSYYVAMLCAIKWREKLNAFALTLKHRRISNIGQRLQEDCRDYPDLMIQICYGGFKAICYILVFSVSLILSFNWLYLIAIIAYSIVGTFIARKISNPLLKLNYDSQAAEATYRNNLTETKFIECISIMGKLAVRTKYVKYFQSFYGQIAVIIPLILIAPEYFAGAMTLGMLMRFNSVANTLFDNTNYIIDRYDMINRLRSCKLRLKELGCI